MSAHTQPGSVEPLLRKLEVLREKSTPGPWRQPSWWLNAIDTYKSARTGFVQAQNPADVALIVAAVNALPRLVAAVRAVLDEHYRIELQGIGYCDEDGSVWPCRTYLAVNATLSEEQS